jgi:PLP dependent protein
MDTISHRLQAIRASIEAAKAPNQHVTLVAVSKTQSAAVIREAFNAGQLQFGENYVQECLDKQNALSDLAIEWHFIGPIQSNKTQLIAQHFAWVHSVDRLKIAQRLNDARPAHLPPLQICIQTNISNENTKSGVLIHELEGLAAAFSAFPRLKLRGLMAIPAPTMLIEEQRAQFKTVRACLDLLNKQGFNLDTLSIGMSDDYLVAIEEGATIVRIGSKIFGARNYN